MCFQLGAAQVLLKTQDSSNFSIPQHCYEYCNTLGWFYDTFEHPQRLKLLYSAAAFLNRNAWHQKNIALLRAASIRILARRIFNKNGATVGRRRVTQRRAKTMV